MSLTEHVKVWRDNCGSNIVNASKDINQHAVDLLLNRAETKGA